MQLPAGGPRRVALHVLALTLAVVCGVFGVVAAVLQELLAGGGVLLVVVAAPLIEEAMKPAGILLLLAFWPLALVGRLHTALLAAISGACFGLLESLIYVEVY